MLPDWLGTETLLGLPVLECEVNAMPLLLLRPDSPAGDYDDVVGDLSRKVPVLGGGTAADVGGREKRRHENPCIIKDTSRAQLIERCRYISSGPDRRSQPSSRQRASRLAAAPCEK